MYRSWLAATSAALVIALASPARGQSAAAQDSTLDNLVHAPGYATAEPGTLGAIVERGRGPLDMVLVSGFGVGASAFDGFMRRNEKRYRMVAVTLPGFEGTSAPPMPAAGTSYGDQTWTRAAADAVVRLIRERKLDRPVLVGHYLNGTQVVLRVAVEHPELARAVVLLAGSLRFEPLKPTAFWPKELSLERKVKMMDEVFAPRWFKTVTRQTWVSNNFKSGDFSTDTTLGARFADLANAPPLPVLVRWLCEYHASDGWRELEAVKAPLLVVRPTFTAALRADSTRNYLASFFEEPWRGRLDHRERTEAVVVEDAGVLVMEDQPGIVDRRVAEFLRRRPR